MENETINLTTLICDVLNSIFFKIFSSIDSTIISNLDNILFINSDIIKNTKFTQIFGNSINSGFLLIANSLTLGIILFYVFNYVISHLIYSKIDSPYQFIFKIIIFTACMNSSLWICEQIINLFSLFTEVICNTGNLITGYEANFSTLINNINYSVYTSPQSFDIFSFDGIIKFFITIGMGYILIIYSIRYVMCKILVLLSPFAFLSLINNQTDGFFKGWFKQFLINLFMQIFVAIILVLGMSLEFNSENILSKLIYLAIIAIIASCKYKVNELFKFIYNFSHNTLKNSNIV